MISRLTRTRWFKGPRDQDGKAGWIFLWLIGVPVPVLFVLFLLRGCT